MAQYVLFNLFALVSICNGLLCYNCHDYESVRSLCSPLNSCRGSTCLLVYINQDFISTCSNEVINADDFCWVDESQRTLCACKTQNCNTIINAIQIRNVTTNPTILNTNDIIQKFIPPTPGGNPTTQSSQTTTKASQLYLIWSTIIISVLIATFATNV